MSLEQTLLDANQRRYDAAGSPLKSHGPDHHYRVYQHAVTLAKKLDVTYDTEILTAAALLHDLAAYYPEQTGEDYHDFDHKIAEEVLGEIDFPMDKIPAVLEVIANHGSAPKFKQAKESVETTLLRDADKLDVFGPIGITRILMVRTLKGDTLQQIVDDFYTHGHLERKWQSITYDETRELAAADYKYSQAFFKDLAAKLKLAERA